MYTFLYRTATAHFRRVLIAVERLMISLCLSVRLYEYINPNAAESIFCKSWEIIQIIVRQFQF